MASQVFRVYKDEESLLRVYNRRLRIADKKFDEDEGEKDRMWGRYKLRIEGDQITSRGHRVSVTTGTGSIDTIFSSMVATDVQPICRIIGNGTREQATAAERALTQGWKDTKGQKRAKKAIKDALVVDIGWVKVYYDYVEDVETTVRAQADVEAEIKQYMEDHPEAGPEDAAKNVPVTEDVPVVIRDRVCVDYVPWKLIRWDQSAESIDDCRWVAQYTPTPIHEVKANPLYQAFVYDRYGERKGRKLLDDLEADAVADFGLSGDYGFWEEVGPDQDQDEARITLVEMWDLETGLTTLFPKGRHDLVLFQRKNPLMFNLDFEDRNPFKPLVVRDTNDSVEGMGDMQVIDPALQELDEYRSNLATHVARSIPKIMGPARAMTKNGIKQLGSQEWGGFIGLEEGHIGNEFMPLTPPPVPQEAFRMQEKLQMEIKDALGVSEPLRGVFPSRRTTATETQIVTAAGEARQAERRGALEDWYINIFRTMLQLMQLFYDRDRMLRFTDDLGQEFRWDWSREDIAIDADIDIALTPKENLTRQERVQRAYQVGNLALAMPETDRSEVLRFMYREMGLRDDEIRALVKTPEEVEMEAQAQQVAAQLSVRPQPFANSPQGLNIAQGGRAGA